MSFNLLSISSMYQGYLDNFYKLYTATEQLNYHEHNSLLLGRATEFAGVYNRKFNQLGINAHCIIANDTKLQNKWTDAKGKKIEYASQVLLDQIRHYKPDVLFIENISFTDKHLIDKIREEISSIRLIAGYHCSPYNSELLSRFRKLDLMITCTPGLLNELERAGIKSHLVYHGFDDQVLSFLKDYNQKKNNVVFSGSLTAGKGFHDERIMFIEEIIKQGIDIELFATLEDKLKLRTKQAAFQLSRTLGDKWFRIITKLIPAFEYAASSVPYYSADLLRRKNDPVYGLEMYNLFASSKIILNFHVGAAGNYAGNMRMFEVTGVGSCLLTDHKANITDLFLPDSEIVTFKSPEECIEKAIWLLNNDADRQTIAIAGQKKTLHSHTVKDRCLRIIDILENELKHR